MKVFQVLNHFLPKQTAGTEVYVWALSKQLQSKNIKVEVVIPNYHKTESAEYTYDGINVFQYAEPSIVDRSLIMGFRKPDGLETFINHLKQEKPNIVHFHELSGSNGISIYHVIEAKKTGAKIIMTFHQAGYTCKTGTLFYKEKEHCNGLIDLKKCGVCYSQSKTLAAAIPFVHAFSSILYKLNIDTLKWQNKIGTALGTIFIIKHLRNNFELLIWHCDKLVTLTHWYKQILMLNGVSPEKICLVPQALPVEVKSAICANPLTPIPIKIVFLGRISPLKGLHILIDAILEMPGNLIELDIYGQSADLQYEKHMRDKTSAHKNIHWNGKLLQEDVIDTLQKYSALCLCSTFSEMSPLVIQEAFAAGIPVIASNVYGNTEQIRHEENGLLFRFKDTFSLKEQLIRCIKDPLLLKRMKKNIQLPRKFKTVGNEYFQIYESLFT